LMGFIKGEGGYTAKFIVEKKKWIELMADLLRELIRGFIPGI